MKSFLGSLIALILSVSVGAEPLLEGRVRLSSGQPAVGVQVRLFDLTDLRRFVGTTTDETGHFALPLQAFSTARGTAQPTGFVLGQNYPNPFNPSTVIPYQIPASAHVRLEVFNLLGQRLATLVNGVRPAGTHTAQWDGTDAAGSAVGAGVYIYRISSGGQTESRRMVLVDGQAGIPAVGTEAQGTVWSAVEGSVEAGGPVYGLTVSGQGLVPYVNPAFRVGIDEADIVIEEFGGIPLMKLAAGGILGDVNNDGQVDLFDALYVLLYSEDPSIMLPNNGDISLGDVNGDGRVDIADAVLLIRYISDSSDPALPSGIGADAPDLELSVLSHMYWTEGNTDYEDGAILRAHLDGSNVDTLVTGLDEPRGLALDMVVGYVYWTDMVAGNIYRVHLDGSNVDTLVTDLDDPRGLALDVAGGHMYWTVGKWGGTIHRADLDGSNDEILTFTSEPSRGLALDMVGGYMYWTEWGAIYRADLDGSKIEIEIPDRPNIEILVTGLDDPRGLALDVMGGHMYWTDTDLGTIHRADLDGANIEILVTGLGDPEGLALDVAGGHMYWTDTDSGYRTGADWSTIFRARLDGSNIEVPVGFGVGLPLAIVLGPWVPITKPDAERGGGGTGTGNMPRGESQITPELIALYGTLISSFQNIFFAAMIPGTTAVLGEGGGLVEIAGNDWTLQDYSPDGALIINGTLNVGVDQDPIPLTGTVTLSGLHDAELTFNMRITVEADGLSVTGTITIDGAEFDVAEIIEADEAE